MLFTTQVRADNRDGLADFCGGSANCNLFKDADGEHWTAVFDNGDMIICNAEDCSVYTDEDEETQQGSSGQEPSPLDKFLAGVKNFVVLKRGDYKPGPASKPKLGLGGGEKGIVINNKPAAKKDAAKLGDIFDKLPSPGKGATRATIKSRAGQTQQPGAAATMGLPSAGGSSGRSAPTSTGLAGPRP